MKPLQQFNQKLKFLFTDIDDTLTDEGQLQAPAYAALWELDRAGIKVVPVTGRPAGWCEMIARQWPVKGIIGENGAFYFRYYDQKMHRYFSASENTRLNNQKRLESIRDEILESVPGCSIASDQFCRLFDLAIDFCEDVPALPQMEIQKIVDIFHKHGAQAKVSSIHVNGWFGEYDKLTMVLKYLEKEWTITPEQARQVAGFSGDSPNDEPMFAYFPNSFGVANINKFIGSLNSPPQYVSQQKGGLGFVEIAQQILSKQQI